MTLDPHPMLRRMSAAMEKREAAIKRGDLPVAQQAIEESRALGAEWDASLRAVRTDSRDTPTAPAVPFDRTAAIEHTAQLLAKYPDGSRHHGSSAKLRADLGGKSDAAVQARCDSLNACESEWAERQLVHDVAIAGARASATQSRRDQWQRDLQTRNDSAMSTYVPSEKWPPGFNRVNAIRALQAVGVSIVPVGSAFQTVSDANDAWLLGALNRLLESTYANAQITAQMIAIGYERDPNGRWRHREVSEALERSLPTPPSTSTRTDAADPHRGFSVRYGDQTHRGAAPAKCPDELRHRDQWRRGLGG